MIRLLFELKYHRRKLIFLLCFFVGISTSILGQPKTVPDSLSLEQTIHLFNQHNPYIIQIRAETERLSELAQFSTLWPNPTLDFDQERIGSGKIQTALIDQPIINPVEFGARRKSANAQSNAFFASYREREAFLYFDLRKKYTRALSTKAQLNVVDQLTKTVRRAIEIIQIRYEEGDVRSFEFKRVQTALADYENRLAQHQLEYDKAYNDLISFISPESNALQKNLSNVVLTDSILYRPLNYSLNQLIQEALLQRGILNAAQFSTEASRQLLRAEKAARLPDFSIRGGFVREPALASSVAPFFGIGIGIPIWNNNGHQIKAVRAEIEQTRAQLDIAKREVQLEVQNAYTLFLSYKDRVEGINKSLLGTTDGLVEDALYLYSEGSISLIELLDAVSASLDARLLKLDLLTQYNISLYQIEYVLGSTSKPIRKSN